MSSNSADRNLLFGILALQMDFISRESLIKAMNDWVLEKQKRLGEILVANDALSPQNRDLLEQMVDAHVESHGGDPKKSLVSLSSVESVRDDLAKLDDSDIQETVSYISNVTLAGTQDATISRVWS